ncbi:class I SAM-dependent methyltransferase [Gracilimonas amylolytica]|uniref:class I SAM-dependent methyltransferase n=1 Tax=Gracilimonas amylolytica TaxID=1749045 RepID=UPI000CD97899|nr:class I SAM-dependent methyltransferase [Gracilimonas amylolytica]
MIHIINDWFISLVDRYMDAHYGGRKQSLLRDHPETIVEIGAAYGANFRYLKPGTKVIVIEPNESYNKILKRRAERFNVTIEIHNTGAESIDLPSDSIDMVLDSLVMCTVEYPDQVLSEIHRILRTGGKFVFIEHVRSEHHTWLCRLQNFVQKPWKWFFDGCHVNRDTASSIDKVPFSKIDLEEFKSKTVFLPIIPHISGTAIK